MNDRYHYHISSHTSHQCVLELIHHFRPEVQNIPVCANAVGGNFFISRDVLGKRAGGKNRRWGKFLEVTAHSAPLLPTYIQGRQTVIEVSKARINNRSRQSARK